VRDVVPRGHSVTSSFNLESPDARFLPRAPGDAFL
jgi:hypothetical protein